MNKISDSNLKFLFVAIVAVLVLISRTDKDNSQKTAMQTNIQDTSLTASALPQVALQPLSVPLAIPLMPYRKDWNSLDPKFQGKAALAKDLDSGADFYRNNSEARWPLASLTKLMTAVIALEEIDSNKIVIVSQTAIESDGPAGNLETGEQYTVADLLKAMLAVSSNDAAEAIAESYGRQNFIEAMQKKAVVLNMNQTVFADSTGLSFLNQATIVDLEKLVRYIYKNHPEIFDITRQERIFTNELTRKIRKELLNINTFAVKPDFFGGKTGFTDQAGGNLISIFNYDGYKILIIVLGTEDRFGQTEMLYNWIKNVYAFN